MPNAIQLQELSPKHKQVASLLAQGLGPGEIARLVEYDPGYISWLCRDPLFKQHMLEMSEVVDTRLEAMYGQVADTIAVGMASGNVDESLKAARLQLEVTGRIGKNDRPNAAVESSAERLQAIASRLTGLLGQAKQGNTFDGTATVVNEGQSA